MYENIEDLKNSTNQLYDEQMKQQQSIINTSTQQTIDELERNKKKTDDELNKTNNSLYTDYQKQINPYGVNAENLAEQGLAKSGLAETTKANYYNTYQTAKTEAMNNANTIKAEFDAKIAQARQNGDLQYAQSAVEMYKQKISDLSNYYNLNMQQEQFDYQKERNNVADNQWQQQYDYQKERDIVSDGQYAEQLAYQKARDTVSDNQWQQQYDYQKERDAVSDSQWQKEYELSKKKSSSSYSSPVTYTVNTADGNGSSNNLWPTEQLNRYTNVISSGVEKAKTTMSAENYKKVKQLYIDSLERMVSQGNITNAQAIEIDEKYGLSE